MKQVILVRKDLQLSKGKVAVQVAHASVEAVLQSQEEVVQRWHDDGMKKVCLKVADLRELNKFKKRAFQEGLVTVTIRDAGLTEVAPGTITAVAIGPADDEAVDSVTGELKML